MAIVNGKKVLAVVQTEAVGVGQASEVAYSGVVNATNVKEALDLLGNTKADRNELNEVKNELVDDNLIYYEEDIIVRGEGSWLKVRREFTNMVVGETYTIISDINGLPSGIAYYFVFFYNGNTEITRIASVKDANTFTFTIPTNTTKVAIDFYGTGNDSQAVDGNFEDINIYKGDKAEHILTLQPKIKIREASVEPSNTTFIEDNTLFNTGKKTITTTDATIYVELPLNELLTLDVKNLVIEGDLLNYTIAVLTKINGVITRLARFGSGEEYKKPFIVPSEATNTHIYIYKNGSGTINVDDIVIYKGSEGECVLNDKIAIVDENYKKYDLPILYLEGNTSLMTKDDAVDLTYKYGSLSGSCTCKYQGTSSMAYPKKNYTIKFDNEFEAKEGWGSQKKYCMKANYIDPSHTRNIGSAKIWGRMVKTRPNAPSELTALVNGGAVDGFFIQIVINGVWQGIYTFNIPKDGWLMGMNDNTKKHAIICAEGPNDTDNLNRVKFITAPQVNGTDFDEEYRSDAWTKEQMVASLATLQSVLTATYSTSEEFKTAVSLYLDIDSVIDYMIYSELAYHSDGLYKNFLLATLDGVKWFVSAYDMDGTFGLVWDGKSFNENISNAKLMLHNWDSANQLFAKIFENCKAEIKTRYLEISKSVFEKNRFGAIMRNFAGGLPLALKVKDNECWVNIPMTETNNVNQIVSWFENRKEYIDEIINNEL